MSSESWKLEKDLCRCCHSEGSFKNLAEPAQSGGLVEIYTDMLNECFDIDMAPVPGLLSAATYTICEICIIRLRDASEFKKQVLTCEERFKDLYNKNIIRASTTLISVEVKQELPEVEPQDTFKLEVSQDEDDDDDYNEPIDIQISEEEDIKPAKVEVPKKRKCKAKKTVKPAKKCVPTKKTKRKSVKVDKADEENDDEAEKKQGQADYNHHVISSWQKTGRVVKPKFFIKEEDYKMVGDKYCCTKCDKTYSGTDSLRHHLKAKHYKIPKYKCPMCSVGYERKAPLAVHKLKAHGIDDRVVCNVCNKMFNSKVQLTVHINNFHMLGEVGRRFKCEFCEYETFKAHAMYKHKYKHKTEKNYHCRFCKKSFMRNSTMRLHEKIHTGERNKVCSECGQGFVQKASLNYHMTKYHPDVSF